MSRNSGLFLALVAGGVLAGGCSGGDSQPSANGGTTADATKPAAKKLTVGFSQIGAEGAWRIAETKSIQDEAAKRGIDLKMNDAQNKQENQIAAIHNFIAQKVDAIILAPKTEKGWDAVLKEAKDAKIPVILVDRGVDVADKSLFVTLIASDFVDEGKRAEKWLAAKLGGTGNVVELEGTVGAAPAIDRKKGFDTELQANKGMKIIASQKGDFTLAKGKEVMEAILKAHPKDINAVYAHNDDMALGAIQAMTAAGLKPGKDIVVVSIDGVKAAMQAIVDGKLNATIECNPLLGPKAFDAVNDALAGKTLEKWIKQTDEQFDDTNAAKMISSRKY